MRALKFVASLALLVVGLLFLAVARSVFSDGGPTRWGAFCGSGAIGIAAFMLGMHILDRLPANRPKVRAAAVGAFGIDAAKRNTPSLLRNILKGGEANFRL